MMVAGRNRRRMATQRRVLKATNRHLALRQAELSELEDDIDGAIRDTPAWQEDADLLNSVPGIGPVTQRTLIAGLPELGQLTRRIKSSPSSASHRSIATAAPCVDAAPSPAILLQFRGIAFELVSDGEKDAVLYMAACRKSARHSSAKVSLSV
jgi:transposase